MLEIIPIFLIYFQTHEMEKACRICGFILKNTKDLYYHLATTHYRLERGEVLPNYNERRKLSVISSNDNDYKMNVCNHSSKINSYKCAICAARFDSNMNLFKHLCGHFPRKSNSDLEPPHKRKRPSVERVTEQIGFGIKSSGVASDEANNSELSSQQVEDDEHMLDPEEPREKLQNTFNLTELSRRHNQRLNAENIIYRVQLGNNLLNRRIIDVQIELYNMFTELVENLRQQLQDGDLVRIYMNHPDLHVPIMVPTRKIEYFQAEDIMAEIEKVLQSEEELKLDEHFEIHVGTIKIPRGGRGSNNIMNEEHKINVKRSIVEIVNEDDNLCFDRSVVVCLAKLNGDDTSSKRWKQIRDRRYSLQKQEALKLRRRIGLPEDVQITLQQICLYEKELDVQIVVVSMDKNILYKGNTNERKLFLYKNGNHYHSIVKIQGFYGKNNYCMTCLVAYNNRNHNCGTTCSVCKSKSCSVKEDGPLICSECNMTCRSQECFERHKKRGNNNNNNNKRQSGQSQCEKYWQCKECHVCLTRKLRSPKSHICGEHLCATCNKYVLQGHLCYQRYSAPLKSKDNFIFYDFESRQDAILECNEKYAKIGNCHKLDCKGINCGACNLCSNCKQTWCGKHKHLPNFAIAHTVCKHCIKDPVDEKSKCESCGSRCDVCSIRDKSGKYLKVPCSDTCGFQERVFKGDGTSNLFSKWLFSRKRAGFTAVAHNMSGYDGYFLLEYLLENGNKPDSIIYQGSKITYMEVKQGLNIRVLDSLKFLPMKLSKLSKAFGLKETKGWFPHYFNLKNNWDYVGPYPDTKFYGESHMHEDESHEFLAWHKEQVNGNNIFNFQKSLEYYCRSDVSILRQSCLLFRKLMMEATNTKLFAKEQPGIDPWSQITIASVCSQIYRSKFLEETWKVRVREDNGIDAEYHWVQGKLHDGMLMVNSENGNPNSWVPEDEVDIVEKHFESSPIAQIPSGGYTVNDKYSKISIIWLEWEMKKKADQGEEDYHIVHALNGSEHRVPHHGPSGRKSYYRLDGHHVESHTAFEFLGCKTHGCPRCITGNARNMVLHPNTRQTIQQLYSATMKRQEYLQQMNYQYVSIWECEFRKQLESNPELKKFAGELSVEERLNPRDAFMGGRTNATTLYYKCKSGERINYIDFTSLYGYVNKYAEYPIGHPSVITDIPKKAKLSDYWGIAKVTVSPPRALLHPVLPVRVDNKLMFPLCHKCAVEKNQKRCQHSNKLRQITGTWCIPELLEAEKRGYVIMKIHEVYHWNKTAKYNPETGKGGLFADYINTFLKVKQEASDWPQWCNDEQSRKVYIENYYEKEGLDPKRIEHNPGLRSIAKLLLVNFWGKWGQRENQLQTVFVDNLATLSEIMVDPYKEIHDFQLINETILLLQYRQVKEVGFGGKKSNVFIAAFTTCFARLKLYEELQRLGSRVLYMDTDSLIYVSRDGDYEPKLGDYLGEFTNELTCKAVGCKKIDCKERHYIAEFLSAGPKNYSYRTDIGTSNCKVRGFTLNKTNSLLINFDFMKELVITPDGTNISRTITEPTKITRHKTKSVIYNRPLSKTYKKVYDKRVILPNYETRPYGF